MDDYVFFFVKNHSKKQCDENIKLHLATYCIPCNI